MKSRLEPRRRIELPVDVYRYGAHLGRFRTGNISFSGLFVDAPGVDLDAGQGVDITIARDPAVFTLRLAVIHCSEQGFGGMRLDCNPVYAEYLHNRLHINDESFAPGLALLGRLRRPG